MTNRLRPRLTYANVISTLCLFIVLGGGAYAATSLPKNSVGTKQLKADAVKSGKVKNGTLKREDAKAGAFVVPSQLGGINAAKLGGIAPGGFVQGAGHLVLKEFDVNVDSESLQAVPGGGSLAINCEPNGHNPYFKAKERSYDVYSSYLADNADNASVKHQVAQPTDSLVFPFPTKTNTMFQVDVVSDAGGASLTMWTRFDNSTKHCIGRIRGVSYP
jgi:hypothetical protein